MVYDTVKGKHTLSTSQTALCVTDFYIGFCHQFRQIVVQKFKLNYFEVCVIEVNKRKLYITIMALNLYQT